MRTPDTQVPGERACQAEETEDAKDPEVGAGMVHLSYLKLKFLQQLGLFNHRYILCIYFLPLI